MAAAGCS